MDLHSLEQLEDKIAELTERFLSLRDENRTMRSKFSDMSEQVGELNQKLRESEEIRKQIDLRVESILSKLEMVKIQADQ